jgi:nickel-dependent lactate racemase
MDPDYVRELGERLRLAMEEAAKAGKGLVDILRALERDCEVADQAAINRAIEHCNERVRVGFSADGAVDVGRKDAHNAPPETPV